MFHRATTAAHKAGVNVNHTNVDVTVGQGIDQSELEEARLRVLYKLKAEYVRAKREGKLNSSGLRVLTEAIDTALDKVEKGSELDAWSELSGRFKTGSTVAKYFNWWPARPILIALKLSFQIDLAWNFLEAHHESSIQGLLDAKGAVSAVQRQVNTEIQREIDSVEASIQKLTKEAPLIVLSVKTKKAALIMLEHYREEMEHLAERGHLDEHEEEHLQHAITNSVILTSYHPTLESLPDLGEVLEKTEFLHDLQPDQRQHLIDVGACYYHEFVGDVPLMEMGKHGARRTKRTTETGPSFRGWFYVVKGQVEKGYQAIDGSVEYTNYSMGTVFGITDTMLGRLHHAGYRTRGFSQLVVFDHHLLMQAAEKMPELEYTLWNAVAAHCLRRNVRFSRCKLHCLHNLLSRAEFLSGRSGMAEEAVIEITAGHSVVLVHGDIFGAEGTGWPLGHETKNSSPILFEPPVSRGSGRIKVSGDYKAFRLASDVLTEFIKEERDRMMMRENMEQVSQALSDVDVVPNNGNPDGARIGAQKAMELMTGLRLKKQ